MAKEPIVEKTILKNLIANKSLAKAQDDFNQYIEDEIIQTLRKKEYDSLKVFALGSLGQRRLCPYSDVDILVVGEMPLVKTLALELGQTLKHLKVRQTVNELSKAALLWKTGFNIFDHYSLNFGRPFLPRDQDYFEELKQKQKQFLNENKSYSRKAVMEEKEKRSARYSDVAGLLQPNFKYGKGGLRDITQALGWLNWFSESYSIDLSSKMHRHLKAYYDQISQLRFAVHLFHENDYVSTDMWEALGEKVDPHWSILELQKNIHKTFNEVKIISDVIFYEKEENKSVKHRSKIFLDIKAPTIKQICNQITASFFTPEEVLSLRWTLQTHTLSAEDQKQLLLSLHERFFKTMDSDFCAQIFESYLIPALVPYWDKIEGRPQSGHYHKYTVDQHLLKTMQAVTAMQNKTVDLFRLSGFVSELTEEDWQVLKWGSVFHDLAKGLPGDHSEVGAQLLQNEIEFPGWGQEFKQALIELTQHHLLLSKAAFRYDHNDAEVLQSIHESLKSFKFFKLLTLFTAADIMASNPEAWNEWKSEQFFHLAESFQAYVNNGKINSLMDIEGFQILVDLASRVGEQTLRQDISHLEDLNFDVKVFELKQNLWIRVYDKDSGPGVLVKILSLFFQAGLSIEQAFICGNDSKQVAYNWFRLPLKTSKKKNEIIKTLNTLMKSSSLSFLKLNPLRIRLTTIRVLSTVDDKWTFLFKGLDQKGLLLRISQVFSEMQLNILKAQVNTWGESVEDVFVIEKREDLSIEEVQDKLKTELIDNFWQRQ